VTVCYSLQSRKSKRTIESRAKRSSKIISPGHYSILLASSYTVKSKAYFKSPTHYPCVGFNSLVYSIRALSALRRSGLRTVSTAAKPCQGDSSEFYLITGRIHNDQRGTVVLATLFNGSEQRHFPNLSEDIQCAGSVTRPPMLDRTDFASWQQRIRLYYRGKDNGVNILKSIDEGPYKLGTFRETLAESTEGTP
nr:integrase, catalytic region, zinc finger, CCHC-type, peptidase aspartic, catalytic [Tanacetum cinerariifolium]